MRGLGRPDRMPDGRWRAGRGADPGQDRAADDRRLRPGRLSNDDRRGPRRRAGQLPHPPRPPGRVGRHGPQDRLPRPGRLQRHADRARYLRQSVVPLRRQHPRRPVRRPVRARATDPVHSARTDRPQPCRRLVDAFTRHGRDGLQREAVLGLAVLWGGDRRWHGTEHSRRQRREGSRRPAHGRGAADQGPDGRLQRERRQATRRRSPARRR